MLNLIQNQILFYVAIIIVLFMPGYFLLLAVFGKKGSLSQLEKFIISFGLSVVIVDFIFFLYSKLGVLITRMSSVAGILIFSAVCFGIYKIRCHSRPLRRSESEASESGNPEKNDWIPDQVRYDKLFDFSKNQYILILLLLFLTIFIKTVFLSGTISPTATDLGHHMYYSKLIAETGKLTDYEDSIINPEDKGKFIIGEHIIFSVIYLVTGQSFFSGWPVVILYLINLLSILTVFILVLNIFENKNIAILTLLFLGVLFAVSAPQARYVSGGVIGNIMGNFLMPLSFYFYYRAFSTLGGSQPKADQPLAGAKNSGGEFININNKDKTFLALSVFVTFGLFYTHHLTGFIFLFIWALIIPVFIILNYKNIEIIGKKALKIIFSPQVFTTFAIGLIFFFFIFTPSYIKSNAVTTAVGSASKATRTGLSLDNLKQTVGDSRLALGFLGFAVLLFSLKKRNLGFFLILSWALMIFIMSVFPKILFVNLPSNRIGNYLTYPLAILSAYGFVAIFNPGFIKKNIFKLVPENLIKTIFLVTLTFVIASGISDSAQAFKKKDNSQEAVQTFDASDYLAKNTGDQNMILKDHNYLTADSWVKLYFMRDYKYPASRTTLSRYEDTTKPREICTYYMISNPASDEGNKCFNDTKTDFIMINPLYDSAQFRKLSDFDQVYINDEVGIYYRGN